jgi:maleylacetoacetate isomerase
MRKFIGEGLESVEAMLSLLPGPLCYGEEPSLADICLAPQLYNARRWGVETAHLKRMTQADNRLQTLPAFVDTAPKPPSPTV